ncbi:MAG: glycosyltransferase family 2 protein, partial [Ktedonobacterales bacterium]|nr:glycosyltransferase family 2 protein [Ktedonobacterales bacterium]
MHVTVCVCTRDRGARIAATLSSLLAQQYPDFDCVVVDQSATDETERAAKEILAGEARFTYLRSTTRGLSAARNIALAHTRGPIVAFTDDDCRVPPDWLSRLVDAFIAYPDAGAVFGVVRAAPHDTEAGYIPTSGFTRVRLIHSPWRKWYEQGIGANMAFRRAVINAVGPFDELLCPGGLLRNADDRDMSYRVLRAGYAVLNTPTVELIHDGYRSGPEARRLAWDASFSIGAAYMKHVRLGDWAALPTLIYEGIHSVNWGRALLLRTPNGLKRLLFLLLGMRSSFAYAVDRRRRVY